MAKVERFEDLIAWQKARELTREIYSVTKQGQFSKDFGLVDQIRRAATSTMSNLAEGFERGGRKEFHQFTTIAKSSCGEVRSLLFVALDNGYLTQGQFNELMELGLSVARLTGALRAALFRQIKHKQPTPKL